MRPSSNIGTLNMIRAALSLRGKTSFVLLEREILNRAQPRVRTHMVAWFFQRGSRIAQLSRVIFPRRARWPNRSIKSGFPTSLGNLLRLTSRRNFRLFWKLYIPRRLTTFMKHATAVRSSSRHASGGIRCHSGITSSNLSRTSTCSRRPIAAVSGRKFFVSKNVLERREEERRCAFTPRSNSLSRPFRSFLSLFRARRFTDTFPAAAAFPL